MTLILQPPRVHLVDQATGLVSKEWYRYFLDLQERVGGVSAPSNSELAESAPDDSGIEETRAELYSLRDSLMLGPIAEPTPYEQFLETAIGDLRAQNSVMQGQIQDLNQGYQL